MRIILTGEFFWVVNSLCIDFGPSGCVMWSVAFIITAMVWLFSGSVFRYWSVL